MDKWVVPIIVALLGAGVLDYVKGAFRAYRARRDASTPEAREALHVATADQSLLVVVKARDELEADNERLRKEGAEDRAQYKADRNAWASEKAEMRLEIDNLEAKVRGLLDEFAALRRRHTDADAEA